jgi:hypothetical protein
MCYVGQFENVKITLFSTELEFKLVAGYPYGYRRPYEHAPFRNMTPLDVSSPVMFTRK